MLMAEEGTISGLRTSILFTNLPQTTDASGGGSGVIHHLLNLRRGARNEKVQHPSGTEAANLAEVFINSDHAGRRAPSGQVGKMVVPANFGSSAAPQLFRRFSSGDAVR